MTTQSSGQVWQVNCHSLPHPTPETTHSTPKTTHSNRVWHRVAAQLPHPKTTKKPNNYRERERREREKEECGSVAALCTLFACVRTWLLCHATPETTTL